MYIYQTQLEAVEKSLLLINTGGKENTWTVLKT
jgi:hypothetical protein